MSTGAYFPGNENYPYSVQQRIEAASKLAVHAASYHAKFGTGLMDPIKVPFLSEADLEDAIKRMQIQKNAEVVENGSYYIQYHGGPLDGVRTYKQAEMTWEHVTAEGNYRYPHVRLTVGT